MEYNSNRSCSYCWYMADCRTWKNLLFAQTCPAYQEGQPALDSPTKAFKEMLDDQVKIAIKNNNNN